MKNPFKNIPAQERIAMGYGILISISIASLILTLLIYNPLDNSFIRTLHIPSFITVFTMMILFAVWLIESERFFEDKQVEEEDGDNW